ncbi:hypothetical protein FNL56_21560 [Tardiphaga sp. vice304]|uniref:hypothetical protein n=1 Tax=Tardiphaga sp. vice304 TaxID=2592817 RepID=UPI0011646BFD|nr:hypothetical protein [Tardiphaga sp. vice304]QDM28411.1 hypothetical protein FNL56_21560 [Tardiphaga sp. vice304]
MPKVLTRSDVEHIARAITSRPMRLRKNLFPKVDISTLEHELNIAVRKAQGVFLNSPATAARSAVSLRSALLRTRQIISSAEVMTLLRLQNKISMPTISLGQASVVQLDADTLQAVVISASDWLAKNFPEELAINIPRANIIERLITKILPDLYIKHFKQSSCPNTVTGVATEFIELVLKKANITNKNGEIFTPEAIVQRRKRIVLKKTKRTA